MGDKIKFIRTDGGRVAAGFKGEAGDCVVRAVAIASGRPYAEVHERFRIGTGRVRHSKRRPSPENGIVSSHGLQVGSIRQAPGHRPIGS